VFTDPYAMSLLHLLNQAFRLLADLTGFHVMALPSKNTPHSEANGSVAVLSKPRTTFPAFLKLQSELRAVCSFGRQAEQLCCRSLHIEYHGVMENTMSEKLAARDVSVSMKIADTADADHVIVSSLHAGSDHLPHTQQTTVFDLVILL
jgi:hypothetical protein